MNSGFSTEHSVFGGDFPQGPGSPMSRFDTKRLLIQAAPVILIVSLVLAVPLSLAVWFLVPLEYEVTSELYFRSTTPTVLDDDSGRRSLANFDKWLTTQLGFLQGPSILTKVAENRQVKQIPQVAEAPEAYIFLKSKVSAQTRSNSEIVHLSVRLEDAKGAQIIIEAVMDEYLSFAAAQEDAMGRSRLTALREERDAVMDKLRERTRNIRDLRIQLGTPIGVASDSTHDEAEAFRTQWAKAETDRSASEAIIRTIEQRIARLESLRKVNEENPNQKIFELDIEAQVNASPRVLSIRGRKDAAEARVRLLEGSLQPGAPQMNTANDDFASLTKQADEVEQATRKEKLEKEAAEYALALDEAKNQLKDATERKTNFKIEIDAYDKKLLDSAGTMAELDEEMLQATEEREILRTLRETINSIYLEQNAPARVTRTSEPVIPRRPDYLRRIQFMIMVTFGALLTGVAAGFLREFMNHYARTVQDIASVTPIPVLGVIPDSKGERLPDSHRPELLTADYPQSQSANEYRRILARIIYPPDETIEVNSCLLASPTRGDGKTSLAVNLAVCLTQSNRSVLLVDVCPKNASVERCFDLEPGRGLAEVLYDEMPYKMLVRETEIPNLKVLGPGFRAEELRGKLASREMMEFLEQAEKDFDNVLFDTPPTLLMSDAKLLAPIVDGVIVTVGVGNSNLGMVRRCLTELDQVNANIIGVVLNGAKKTRGGYMGKNLDLFHSYSPEDLEEDGDLDDIPEMAIHEEDKHMEPAIVLLAEEDEPDLDKEE